MWTILLLVCIALTIYDSANLLSKYNEEDVVVEVSLETNHSKADIPLPEVCIVLTPDNESEPFDFLIDYPPGDTLYDEIVQSGSIDRMLESFDNETDIISYLLDVERDMSFTEENKRNGTLLRQSETSLEYLPINCHDERVYLCAFPIPVGRKRVLFESNLRMLSKAELKTESYSDVTTVQYTTTTERRTARWSIREKLDFTDAVQKLHEFYEQKNASLVQVMQATGTMICQLITKYPDYPVASDKRLESYCSFAYAGEQAKSSTVTYAGGDPFQFRKPELDPYATTDFYACFRLPNPSNTSEYRVMYDTRNFKKSENTKTSQFRFVVSYAKPEATNILPRNSEITFTGDEVSSTTTVTTVADFTHISTRTNRCAKSQPRWCALDNLYAGLYSECDCYPLSWLKYHPYSSSNRMCVDVRGTNATLAALNSCLSKWKTTIQAAHKDGLVDPSCRSACRTTLLSINTAFDGSVNANIMGDRIATFTVVATPFTAFSERLEMTSQDFVSELGGVLSLYIGASFLAIYHFFVFLVRVALDACERSCLAPKAGSANTRKTSLGRRKAQSPMSMRRMSSKQSRPQTKHKTKQASRNLHLLAKRHIIKHVVASKKAAHSRPLPSRNANAPALESLTKEMQLMKNKMNGLETNIATLEDALQQVSASGSRK